MLLSFRIALAGLLGVLASIATAIPAKAQPPSLAGVGNNDPEVLARGPVHEAFAASSEQPTAGDIAPKAPPDPIEELPPDQKPEGDNVQWIPGYWSWDAERMDYIWISGFWRQPPPNHVWVPGSWNATAKGFQWTSGFWQIMAPNQTAAPEIEYLPQPPPTVEVGPAFPAPDPNSVYVSGSWVWRGRYVWRPGFWAAGRPNWIWTPAHYRWTPLGYVFIDGYWDYPLATRGVLFTPVYFPRPIFAPGYMYTPAYVVAETMLFGALFVRGGHSSYYFGDYYDAAYARGGYTPWCAPALRGNVAVLPARGWHYDPLWSYYSVANRQAPQWTMNVTKVYTGRYDGTLARPPRTLAQQNQVIQKVTNTTVNNVTNNLTVVNNNITVNNTNVSQHVMVAPLSATSKLQPETKLQAVTPQVRQAEVKHAAELRQVAVVRQKAEAEAFKARPQVGTPPGNPAASPPPQQPVKLKVDVPKNVVTRSAVAEEKKQPPPAPVHPMLDHKVDPPKFTPLPPVTPPKIDPKGPPPKTEPKGPPPKIDPKGPPPKIDPKGPPPKVDPKNPPKVDPKDKDPKDPKKKD